MERCEMRRIEITTTRHQKSGDSNEICFMALGEPFLLQAVRGAVIKEVTVENGYYWDGVRRTEEGKYHSLRQGSFTVTVKASIPREEVKEVKNSGCA